MTKKVLVADDEQEIVMVLQDALKREGFDVITAFDGKEAQAKISSDTPDVIILDLMMPKMHGWEVLSWLRKEAKKNTPAIIISAKDEMGDIKRSYDLQADYYIIKPVKINDVLKGIYTLLLLKTREEENEGERKGISP